MSLRNESWPTCAKLSKTLSHIFFIVKVMSMGLVGIESGVQIYKSIVSVLIPVLRAICIARNRKVFQGIQLLWTKFYQSLYIWYSVHLILLLRAAVLLWSPGIVPSVLKKNAYSPHLVLKSRYCITQNNLVNWDMWASYLFLQGGDLDAAQYSLSAEWYVELFSLFSGSSVLLLRGLYCFL